MKKINLIYWPLPNYGDALSPLLIEELSGMEIQYKDLYRTRWQRLQSFFKLDSQAINEIIYPGNKIVGAIGSILSWLPKGALVWGSGFMNESEKFKGGKLHAVRGKLTASKLVDQGFESCTTFGDPALLLPLWIKASGEKKYKVGLIPHWKEYEHFYADYGNTYKIIDFRTKDVKLVTEEIASCDYIISTSLHGVIVAHAYGIPALWIKYGNIGTDGFKFHDYFSSVDIPLYNGFENIEEILQSEQHIVEFFLENQDKSQIRNNLQEIQKGLLKQAPFPLVEKYRKLISETR